MPSPEGNLTWLPLTEHLDLVAEPVAAAADHAPGARVARIDETLADTAAFCEAYDVTPDASANCVVVQARRGEVTTMAAVMVLATDRADVNNVVRRHLGARKISFADPTRAEELTGMRQGGITPIGLPADWPVLVDERVAAAGPVVIGAGERGAKILVDGSVLAALPSAAVLDLVVR
jgi:prolyl-tRNA editing enzyme YbaK/EbsC (Cys-tRNA(Pro) deacylase)